MQREKKPNETTKNPKTTNLKQQTQNKPTFPTQVFFPCFPVNLPLCHFNLKLGIGLNLFFCFLIIYSFLSKLCRDHVHHFNSFF